MNYLPNMKLIFPSFISQFFHHFTPQDLGQCFRQHDRFYKGFSSICCNIIKSITLCQDKLLAQWFVLYYTSLPRLLTIRGPMLLRFLSTFDTTSHQVKGIVNVLYWRTERLGYILNK